MNLAGRPAFAFFGNATRAKGAAERNLKKAIEMDPNLAAAHFNLGQLYELQNRSDLGLASYQSAYELDSSGSIGNMAATAYNELLRDSLSN